MLDALIYRQNRKITRPAEPAIIEERLERTQDRRRPIRLGPYPINKIGAGQVKLILRDCFRLVIEQRTRVRAKQFFDAGERRLRTFHFGGHFHPPDTGFPLVDWQCKRRII
jgi:hypothetical protein